MSTILIADSLGKCYRRHAAAAPVTLRHALSGGFRRFQKQQPFWAIQDVSFELEEGAALGLVGSNGAGKSTLLRLVGQVIRPDTGSVETRGRLGGLLQMTAGFRSDLTGRDNLHIAGLVRGLSRDQIRAGFSEMVEFAGLERFIDEPVRTYSSGMRMRLAFSVAVHARTDILLVDEALAVGDASFRERCQARLDELRATGCTLLIASHQVQVIEKFCSQALWLHQGRIVAHGDPVATVNDYLTFLNNERTLPDQFHGSGLATVGQDEDEGASATVALTNVSLLDESGSNIDQIACGQSLQVRIALVDPAVDTDLVVSVAVGPRDKPPLGTIRRPWPAHERRSQRDASPRIALTLDRLDVAPGDYMVYVAVHASDWSCKHDAVRRVLSVTGTGAGSGPMLPPHDWSQE